MEVKGYKAFNKGLTNRYGRKFEIGKQYSLDGKISFGNDGNGFHFCKNIEEVLFIHICFDVHSCKVQQNKNFVELLLGLWYHQFTRHHSFGNEGYDNDH